MPVHKCGSSQLMTKRLKAHIMQNIKFEQYIQQYSLVVCLLVPASFQLVGLAMSVEIRQVLQLETATQKEKKRTIHNFSLAFQSKQFNLALVSAWRALRCIALGSIIIFSTCCIIMWIQEKWKGVGGMGWKLVKHPQLPTITCKKSHVTVVLFAYNIISKVMKPFRRLCCHHH